MTGESKYEGWKNYETWLVALWLNNKCMSYRHSRELALQCWNDSTESIRFKQWNWTRRDAAIAELAELLERRIMNKKPIYTVGMFGDLLSAALSAVDWREVAENLIDEVREELALNGGEQIRHECRF